MSNATLFLSDISVVDHAYIDNNGNVVGGSYNPSFLVSGKVDPKENVVVDFSTIKKDIKNIIDAKENGFDHKLWIVCGFSNCTYSMGPTNIEIDTPTTQLSMPKNAVTIIDILDADVKNNDVKNIAGTAMGRQVEHQLNLQYPLIDITVECRNSTNQHLPFSGKSPGESLAKSTFTYVHGLKDSTSWGCQNISHGHLSYLILQSGNTYNVGSNISQLAADICDDIDKAVFINTENIVRDDSDSITIEYTTPRGVFKATYSKSAYNTIVLETETTVEHLVEYVCAKYERELQEAAVQIVYLSEGLSKGACITL